MAATRSRMLRPVECARRNTVRNGCLERAKGSAATPPLALSPVNRPPQQRTPQHLPLQNSDQESRLGRRPGPLRPLRRKDSPHRRPPSLPSKRREPISKGNPPLTLIRPPKLGRWLCENRARARPGIWYSGVVGQRSNPRLRATAALFRPAEPAGKLGGTVTFHRTRPLQQERLCAGHLKDIPFRGRAHPHQRAFRALSAAW